MDEATERDMALDIIAALDMYDGLMGSETTHIERVDESTGKGDIAITLDNGQRYILTVREG